MSRWALGVLPPPSGSDVLQGGVSGVAGEVVADFSSSNIFDNLLEVDEVVDADTCRLIARLEVDRGEGEGEPVLGLSQVSIDLREARRLRAV